MENTAPFKKTIRCLLLPLKSFAVTLYAKCSPSGLKERKTQMFPISSSSTSKLLIQIQITLSLLRDKSRPKPVPQHRSSSRRTLPCLGVSTVVRGRILLPLLQLAVLLCGPSREGRTSHYLQYHQPASPMMGMGEKEIRCLSLLVTSYSVISRKLPNEKHSRF